MRYSWVAVAGRPAVAGTAALCCIDALTRSRLGTYEHLVTHAKCASLLTCPASKSHSQTGRAFFGATAHLYPWLCSALMDNPVLAPFQGRLHRGGGRRLGGLHAGWRPAPARASDPSRPLRLCRRNVSLLHQQSTCACRVCYVRECWTQSRDLWAL